MNIFRLLQIHLELECLTFDHRGDLIFLPCPDPDSKPRVYVGHHAQGYITLFHHDLPPMLREEISALAPESIFQEPEHVQKILERDAPCEIFWRGKSYLFQQRISREMFPDVIRLDNNQSALFADASKIAEQPTFAIVQDGEIVSACESARENKYAGEAWVRTHEEFRRRGFGRQTALAWAHDLLSRKKIPFYSHRLENTASEALARGLGLGHWVTDIAFA